MKPADFDIKKSRPGNNDDRIGEMLRVDHAGEFGAVQIYRGQQAVFQGLSHKHKIAALLKEMEDGEAHHLETFDKLLADRNIRPTLFSPLWNAAGFGLGVATALMGEKSAMACTAAVEEVIEEHYAKQAEELQDIEPELAETIQDFREDELDHKHTAEEQGASDAFGFTLLKTVIQTGCQTAIKLSEKI